MTRDELYMKKALELAEIAAEQGEVPVGAIVVKRSSGEIIGRGFNRREYGRSPLTHAELVAIEEASRNLGGWRLMGCELFVTLEPCPMCTGAIINSRIERVVFGAYDQKAGSCGSVVNLFELPYNHISDTTTDVFIESAYFNPVTSPNSSGRFSLYFVSIFQSLVKRYFISIFKHSANG